MKKRGFTLIELLVVIAIIAMLLAILMPALNKVKKIAQRVVCGTNLKGLGTAQTVYANDYDDEYTVQGGKTNPTLANFIPGGGWQISDLKWSDSTKNYTVTVGSSLYLLVREADVSPKSFVCPASDETAFDGKNNNNLDIIQLWDFGGPDIGGAENVPANHVSYSYHMPYKGSDPSATGTTNGKRARYTANGTLSAAFAVMADKSPYFDDKLEVTGSPSQPSFISQASRLNLGATPAAAAGGGLDWESIDKWKVQVANSQPHDREGQNVLYADGHTNWETRSDVGVKNDGIFTGWTATSVSAESDWRIGAATQALATFGKSRDDSTLVNDGNWE